MSYGRLFDKLGFFSVGFVSIHTQLKYCTWTYFRFRVLYVGSLEKRAMLARLLIPFSIQIYDFSCEVDFSSEKYIISTGHMYSWSQQRRYSEDVDRETQTSNP